MAISIKITIISISIRRVMETNQWCKVTHRPLTWPRSIYHRFSLHRSKVRTRVVWCPQRVRHFRSSSSMRTRSFCSYLRQRNSARSTMKQKRSRSQWVGYSTSFHCRQPQTEQPRFTRYLSLAKSRITAAISAHRLTLADPYITPPRASSRELCHLVSSKRSRGRSEMAGTTGIRIRPMWVLIDLLHQASLIMDKEKHWRVAACLSWWKCQLARYRVRYSRMKNRRNGVSSKLNGKGRGRKRQPRLKGRKSKRVALKMKLKRVSRTKKRSMTNYQSSR